MVSILLSSIFVPVKPTACTSSFTESKPYRSSQATGQSLSESTIMVEKQADSVVPFSEEFQVVRPLSTAEIME